MKNDTISGRMIAIMSTIIISIVCFISGAMYYITGYYIYNFLFISSVFVAATQLLFIFLKVEDTRHRNPKPPKEKKIRKIRRKKKMASESEEEPTEKEKKKRKKFPLHKIFLPFCLVA